MTKARAEKLVRQSEPSNRFDGVKVFTATMFAMREKLSELVSDWIVDHRDVKVQDIIVTQSSDAQFHCLSISLFYLRRPEH